MGYCRSLLDVWVISYFQMRPGRSPGVFWATAKLTYESISKLNEQNMTCSHIQGMFYRTSRMIQAGMKPVYVFDGKPPQMKRDELDRRYDSACSSSTCAYAHLTVYAIQPCCVLYMLACISWPRNRCFLEGASHLTDCSSGNQSYIMLS